MRFKRLFLSNMSKRKALISFTIAAAVLTVGYGCCRFVCRRRGRGVMSSEIEDDGIVFADSVESGFVAALKSTVKSRQMQLLHMLDELEGFVAKRDALCNRSSEEQEGIKPIVEVIYEEGSDGIVEGGDVEELITRLNQRIEFQALHLNELLTQYVVLLDGLPVGGRGDLRHKRRTLIQEAIALADRITPHLGSYRQKTNAAAIQLDGEGLGTSNIVSIEADESEEEMSTDN